MLTEMYFIPWHWNDFLLPLTPSGRRIKKNLRTINEFIDNVITERRRYLDKKFSSESNDFMDKDAEFERKNRLAFLDCLLATQHTNPKLLSDLEIRWEVNTFMFAGHDTLSSAISFCIYLLGLHPHVQKKLQQEIDIVMGADEDITEDLLLKMKYLGWIIKEALRLYPPVYSGVRELKEDFEIDGHVLPKGVAYFFSIYHIHRDPEVFTDPDKFVPERWENNYPPYSFIPFSAGPRNCIGQKFAMMEIKTLICSLCKNYTIESLVPWHQLELSLQLILRSQNPVPIKFIRRTTGVN